MTSRLSIHADHSREAMIASKAESRHRDYTFARTRNRYDGSVLVRCAPVAAILPRWLGAILVKMAGVL